VDCQPDFAEAHCNLAAMLWEQGDPDAAHAAWLRALELKPNDMATLGALLHNRQQICQWDDLQAMSRRLVEFVDSQEAEQAPAGASVVPPGSFLCLPIPTTALQQWRCGQQWVARQPKPAPPAERTSGATTRGARGAKIALGYLSSDFHTHATAYLIAELLEQHDRSRFEVYGYSYGTDDSTPLRGRIVHAFDQFVELREASIERAVQRIVADDIDILVDLKGYTRDARPQILAARPAPIQVNYLGYPCTMAAACMDYILVDDFVVPSDQQPFFTEKLVYLPGCYQANDSRREIAHRTPSRAECGLPEAGFVFASFNNSYKITPEMFAVWMHLLRSVPGSVLWLLQGNAFVPVNLRREAAARGVAGERLVFAEKVPVPDHLARHCLVDLMLDCFPVNAHTTASDALWAGCPLLTLLGETFVSRVAGSLLHAMGLAELITTSPDEYQQMALRLARDAGLLADVRKRLAANRATCGLFDGARFARNVEKAYAQMVAIHAAGEPPRPFTVV
jgi:predicted O-linked N-acetylglucosamine transferase (SPINDLY family)